MVVVAGVLMKHFFFEKENGLIHTRTRDLHVSSPAFVLCAMWVDDMSLNFYDLVLFQVEMGLKTQDLQGTLVAGAYSGR